MLLIGGVAWIALGMVNVFTGLLSGAAALIGFLLVAIIGIAGGSYVSVRYITPLSVLHPIVAAGALGLVPIGVVLQGDVGLVRFAILLGVVVVSAAASFISRRIAAPPNTSFERTRDR
jgi:hypothetical protein